MGEYLFMWEGVQNTLSAESSYKMVCGLYSQVILERVMEKSEIQFLAY